ncbi:MAG: Ig-like domain-containing protein [Pseudomonadota bacterium]
MGTLRFLGAWCGAAALAAVVWLCLAWKVAADVPAPTGPAFACDGNIYQVQSGQLRIFNPITSTYQNVGPRNGSYNATGYNVLDDYAYASQGSNIIRISSDGVIQVLFNVGFGTFSGDIDFNNGFWLRRNNERYERIDLVTEARQVVDFTQVGSAGGGPADVAYVQDGGDELLIGFGGGRMYRYNITAMTKERFTVPSLPGGGFGATWTDGNGRMLTFNNNNGLLYEVFDYLTNSPSMVQVGTGVPSGNNDGFSCSRAAFPNLQPLAQDDDFTTPLNTAISGNVTADNGNGVDNDPDGTPITVNPTPLLGPSNGSVVLNTDGSFTYTPGPNFIGVDTFEYEVEDAAGLTATALVTITVTGTIDFTALKTQVSGPNPATSVGDLIGYEVVLQNTGDIDLTGVVVTDTLPDGSVITLTGPVETGGTAPLASGVLDVGETWTYSTSYSVTQADLDSGAPLTNSVSASTTQTGLPKSSSATTAVTQSPSFTLSKVVDIPTLSAPGVLTYEIEVVNTGNVTLTGVGLTDTLTQGGAGRVLSSGPDLTGDLDGDGELDVGETWRYAATFNATQDEINDGGDIVNTAQFTTLEAGSQTQSDTTTISQSPALTVSKDVDQLTLASPGTLAYSIEVANTGNVGLTGVALTDTLTQGGAPRSPSTPVLLSGDANADMVLGVGETWVYGLSYAVTQADLDNGADLVNSASVTTTQGAGGSNSATTTLTQTPSFTLVKSVDKATLSAPGTLTYSVVIENTGNLSLTGGSLIDTLTQGGAPRTLTSGPDLSGDLDTDGVLDVGETWIYAAQFAAQQSDIDDGADISNEARFDPNEAPAQTSTAVTSITQTPGLSLGKAVSAGEPTSFDSVGDTIEFTFTLTNTGNTTLTAPITVNDNQIGNNLSCRAAPLAPGASTTCAHVWTADQDDLNAGSVTNSAQATSANGVVSGTRQATVTAVQSPALSITKSIVAPVPTIFAAGQVLNYEYLVTNTGNVTFTQAVTVDDNITTVTCPPLPGGDLIPGESLTCTASYQINSNDEQLGSTTNVARAESQFNGVDVASPTDDAIFPVSAAPTLDLTKEALPAGLSVANVGDTITYRYSVTNVPPATGPGAALTEEIFVDDNKFAQPILCRDPAVEGSSFLPNATHVCEAMYTVTQADLDAGTVANEATARTVFAPASLTPVNVTSVAVNETVPVIANPQLTVSKSITSSAAAKAVGETVSYEIIARNSGNQTLSNVMISDPLLGALTCDLTAPVTLLPTEVLTCTGSYTVQQQDIDDQTVGDAASADLVNTATGAANRPDGTALPPATDDVTQELVAAAPGVSIAKALFPDLAASPAYMTVGDAVSYRMTVTNTGNMTLASAEVTDSLVAGPCMIGPLAPGASDTSCTFTYVVTQADIDAGQISNIGQVSSQPIDPNAAPVTADDTLMSPGPNFMPGLEVLKSGVLDLGADGRATPGDLIAYTITVENTGNVTVSDIAVSDPGAEVGSITYAALDDPDGDGDINQLAPGQLATVTARHPITQAEIDAGVFANQATALGQDPSGGAVSDQSDSTNPGDGAGSDDPTVTPIPRDPGLQVTKTPSITAGAAAGDTILYSYVVENTGNVTLTNILLTDDHTSASGTAPLTISGSGFVSSLAPGVQTTLTATYVVTQADIDDGTALTNEVTATGQGPTGTGSVSQMDTAQVDLEAPAPDILTIKRVSAQTGSAPGDTVTFQIIVENTGNVSLAPVTLTDSLQRLNGTVLTAPVPAWDMVDTAQAGVLDVGEVWTYFVTHSLTQDDIDAGGISNSATATGTAPDGTMTSDTSDALGTGDAPTLVQIVPMPGLEVVKTLSNSATTLGSTVSYDITLRNTGNVTLSSVSILNDTLSRNDGTVVSSSLVPSFVGASLGSGAGTLQVGETATYALSHVLTQADIDAGGLTNTATAEGSPPLGAPVTDVSDNTGPGSDPTVLTIPAAPGLALDKRLKAGSGPSFNAPGQVLVYEFEVTNTGNVTLNDPVSITDALITNAGGSIICAAGPLAPGASLLCEGSYAVTQADVDAGERLNSATASAGATVSNIAETRTPATQTPALMVVKTADPVPAADFITGAVITYTYDVTNTGNTTLTTPVQISDNLIADGDITCPAFPATGLAPGALYQCSGSYSVTQSDVDLGSVTNLASASSGPTVSPLASETIPESGVASLSISKTLIRSLQPDLSDSGGLTFDEVGDVLEYEFSVTNDGTRAFTRDVVVNDDKITAPIVCFTPTAGDPDFTAGESTTCIGQYVVTQEDLDNAQVINQAFAETLFGAADTPVVSPPMSETAQAVAMPGMTVVKSVMPANYSSLGQVVSYAIEVTNSGNQTLTSVSARDPLLPGLLCESAELAPGEVLNCSEPYTITQEDIDRGSLTNTAEAIAIDPAGQAAPPASGSVTSTGPSVAPTIALRKSASPDPFGPVGSVVSFAFEVENTSIYTLSNIVVTDPLVADFLTPAFSCAVPDLPPGGIDTSCVMPYTVTQDDVNAGQIANTGTVEATDPFGNVAVGMGSATPTGPPQVPGLEVTKLAEYPATSLGSQVSYTLIVDNTGNVSLGGLSVSDTMERLDGTATSLTSPFVLNLVETDPDTGAFLSGDVNNNGRLDPDETWIYSGSYQITQADINAGGFQNVASAKGIAPDGSVVEDTADDGNDADGNTTNDPTVVPITTVPDLSVTKTVTTPGSQVGDEVIFLIAAANIGNVDITGITSPVDQLTRRDGTDITGGITSITEVVLDANGNATPVVSNDGTLSPSEVWYWQVRYPLAQEDVDAGGIRNTAQVTGQAPDGSSVTDTSDDGDDTDGNLDDDPTEMAIAPAPGLLVTKTLLSPLAPQNAGEVLTFEITALNTGNVTLSGMSSTDTLTNFDGGTAQPALAGVTGLTNGALGPQSQAVFTYTYALSQADVDSGGINNSATVSGQTPFGAPVVDVSDDDGTGNDDPTTVAIAAAPSVDVLKSANVPTRIAPDLFAVTFTIRVENTGNVTLENLSVQDDLASFASPAIVTFAQVSSATGMSQGTPNPGFDGLTDLETLLSGARLAPGELGVISLEVQYNTATGVPTGTNTAEVRSDQLNQVADASTTVVTTEDPPDILATKSVSPEVARRGDLLRYTLTFQNPLPTAEGGLTLIDDLPAGIAYVEGSATFNGAATPQPSRDGRRLSWADVTLPANGTIVITLTARLIGGPGRYANQTYALGPDGSRISNRAEAVFEVAPEGVFDCSDVIGKVWDDRNADGVQQAPDRRALSDQDVFGSKTKTAPQEQDLTKGEPGIAGARVVTPRGTTITTDAFGRFSVPCAELPSAIGSNFTLKLDPRSLPTGYRVIGENPRVTRLTPGKMARVNFPVSLATVINVDLTLDAFAGQTPVPGLITALEGLYNSLDPEGAYVLRLTYLARGEPSREVQEKLSALETRLDGLWKSTGGAAPMLIERQIVEGQ